MEIFEGGMQWEIPGLNRIRHFSKIPGGTCGPRPCLAIIMASFISNQDLNISAIIHQLKFVFIRVWLWIEMDCCWLYDQIRWLTVIIDVHMRPGLSKQKYFSLLIVFSVLPPCILRREVTFKSSTTRMELCTRLSTAMAPSFGDPQVSSNKIYCLTTMISGICVGGRYVYIVDIGADCVRKFRYK